MLNNKKNRYSLITSIVVLSIAFDQLSKIWVRINVKSRKVFSVCEEWLPNPHFSKLSDNSYLEETQIISDYFILMNVENFGAFLGFGSCMNQNMRLILLIILPIVVLISITIFTYIDKTLDKISIIGFSLIIGGGVANIFDRIVYGSVTDFLYINLGGIFKTGIFNIADLSVTTGMILILISSFKRRN